MKDKKILKKNFSENILKKIKKEKIKKIPKCIFIFKHLSVWVFLIMSIFIWALSFSISFDYITNVDWSLLHKLWVMKIVTIFMPIFWVIFLLIASFLSYYNFRHTEKWYKYSFSKILIINIFLSLILGIFLYFTWIHHSIELIIEKNIPKYRLLFVEDNISRVIKIWQNENKWLLIWKITEVSWNLLVFKDFNSKTWNILLNKNTKTDIKHIVNIRVWEKIKIIWEKINDNNFEAKEIRPFMWNKNRNRNK